ncbi:hypothetical protein ACFQX7_33860 [Luedemannella flava]
MRAQFRQRAEDAPPLGEERAGAGDRPRARERLGQPGRDARLDLLVRAGDAGRGPG